MVLSSGVPSGSMIVVDGQVENDVVNEAACETAQVKGLGLQMDAETDPEMPPLMDIDDVQVEVHANDQQRVSSHSDSEGKILYGNVRGLGTSRKRLLKMVRSRKPCVFAVAEPFVDGQHLGRLQSDVSFEGSVSNQEVGGKLWVLWSKNVKVSVLSLSFQSITTAIEMNGKCLWISFVYAKCYYGERRQLWDHLCNLHTSNVPWMVIGDFNIIKSEQERIGGHPRPPIAMEEFNSFVDRAGLSDLGGIYLAKLSSDHALLQVDLSPENRRCRTGSLTTKLELDVWNTREEICLAQQEKQEWLNSGEASSKFFKAMASNNHKLVGQMKISENEWLKTLEEVHTGAVDFFQNFLATNHQFQLPDLSSLIDLVIQEDDNVNLLELPSIQEVKQAIFSILTDSSPGPDGFGSGFYKACWDIVAMDVVDGVHDFFGGGKIPREFTASFLVFISKEMIQNINKPVRGGNVVLKIDMAKAYDSMNWDFLIHSLASFGFSEGVCSLVHQCISSPWFSVVMNGILKGFFQGGRGLRQGDPLSPYLFILGEEIFSRLLKKSFQERRIIPFQHPRGAPIISHLLYANDIVIFANGDKKSIRAISEVLTIYENWSGQRVNKEKSSIIFSKIVPRSRRRNILSILGFSEGLLPFKYLGVPIVSGRLKAVHFDEFLCKIRDKIGGWSLNLSYPLYPDVLAIFFGDIKMVDRRNIGSLGVRCVYLQKRAELAFEI
ncbi:uncharacterized protein LOC122313615 [Carya illinoinensis]|uniref:uncharacterized protein LOC122313615 n=1 Tax=Carya illinoinensis TaxID=32201 RepID=UPI001C71C320|nr:uncharacterized protein LOC122313615 [Carya illinoinensis]